MTDETYVLSQTNRERKSAGTGAYHRKGGSKSKRCTLPSDHLTASQLKKRSSAVMTYNTSKPMKWEEFSKLDKGAKEFYLEAIASKYKPRACDLAEMFGVSRSVISRLLDQFPTAARLMTSRGSRSMSKEWAYFIDPVTHDPVTHDPVTHDPVTHDPVPDCVKTSGDSNDTPGARVITPAHAITRDISPSHATKGPAPTPAISGSITLDATPMQLVAILQSIFGDTAHHFTVSFE